MDTYEKKYKNALGWMRSVYPTLQGVTKEDAEHYFPELRENEDERVVREMLEYFTITRQSDFCSRPDRQTWIAWLEKQKEYHIPWYDYQKSKEAGYTIVPNEEYEQLIKQKEQKPSIFPPGLGEVHWNPIPSGKDVHKWNLPEDFEEAVYKVANFISPFDSQEELRRVSHRFAEQLISLAKKELIKKPVQSAEEKEFIRTIKSIIADFIRDKKPEDVGYYQRIYDWLDDRHIEPKPVEWSEEAENMVNNILYVLGQYIDYKAVSGTGSGYATPRYAKEMDWLKSLRPQWKPTEEQIEALQRAVNKLAESNVDVADSVRLSIIYDNLKKL